MEERGTPVLSENESFQVKTRRENNVRIKKTRAKKQPNDLLESSKSSCLLVRYVVYVSKKFIME